MVRQRLLVLLFVFMVMGFALAYQAPSFANQPILVESDSDFYGSDQGQVTIDLNLTPLDLDAKDFFIRITGLDNTSATVKEISFNKEKIETLSYHVSEKSKTKMSLVGLEKKPMQIILEFDPEEIGLGLEFDIQLVTKDGTIIADLDPFLSGWGFRQEWCANTNGISLSGDVTKDLSIVFVKTSADTDFWDNVDSAGADVRFTNLNNGEYYYYFQVWDYGNTSMIARSKITQTFTSSEDTCGYIYYGNDGASDSQSAVNSFGTDEIAYWNFDEASGDLLDQIGSNDGTSSNITYSQTGQINNAFGFNGTTSNVELTGLTSTTGNYSFSFWADNSGNLSHYFLDVQSGRLIVTLKNASSSNNIGFYDGAWKNFGATASTSGLKHYVFTFNSSSGFAKLYVNGVKTGSDLAYSTKNLGGDIKIGAPYDGTGSYEGLLDEFGIYTSVLSADEIKISYNSELKTLVTFSAQESEVTETIDLNFLNPTNEQVYINDINIQFEIIDTNILTNTIDFNLFYSTSAGSKTNLIINDSNLLDGIGITCNDYNFLDSTQCNYVFDVNVLSDGNYFIDGEALSGTGSKENSSEEFEYEFKILKPIIANFETIDSFLTTSTVYTPVFEFDFNATQADKNMFIKCEFGGAGSSSTQSMDGNYLLEYSFDGISFLTADETRVTYLQGQPDVNRTINLLSNLIVTPSLDNNVYVRLSQKRVGGNGIKTIALYDPVCSAIVASTITGESIPISYDVFTISTSSLTYVDLGDIVFNDPPFPFRLATFTALTFSQTGAKGTPYIKYTTPQADSPEFMRTVGVGEFGSGAITGVTGRIPANTNINFDLEMKTTAGTGTITGRIIAMAVSYGVGEYKATELVGETFTTGEPQIIYQTDFNNKEVAQGYNGVISMPYSCSTSECTTSIFTRVQGTGYDINSSVRTNTGATTIGDIRFNSSDYFFNTSVPQEDGLTYTVYGSTGSGTATITGGGAVIIPFFPLEVSANLAPQITLLQTIDSNIFDAPFDLNFAITDDSNCLAGTLDVNVYLALDDSVIKIYNPEITGSALSCDAFQQINNLALSDNNYYIQYTFFDEFGFTGLGVTGNFLIDNNAPTVEITNPVASRYNKNNSISVEFEVEDEFYTTFLIDLNYSLVSVSSVLGVPILLQESTAGANIICIGTSCVYSWDASGVADGNYYLLINASAGLYTSFDASEKFELFTGDVPASPHTKRYINPQSNQRDSNIFYNPDSEFNLTEDEKQTDSLKRIESIIFFGGVIFVIILIIIGVFVWKKRK